MKNHQSPIPALLCSLFLTSNTGNIDSSYLLRQIKPPTIPDFLHIKSDFNNSGIINYFPKAISNLLFLIPNVLNTMFKDDLMVCSTIRIREYK